MLKTSASEKPWRAELKPVRSTATHLPRPMPPPILLPYQAPETQAVLVAPLPSPSGLSGIAPPAFNGAVSVTLDSNPALTAFHIDTLSDTLSDTMSTTTTSTILTGTDDDPEALSTPKPDLSVGLAHTWFATPHQRLLAQPWIQSDPHQARIGLHFPFLIFEAKGSGSLFGAQNQAAVGAACMLKILDTLGCADVVLSVTTEGPVHELWVHHRVDQNYHSTFVDIWRMTATKAARQFIETLARIMTWVLGPLLTGCYSRWTP